jgi:threonine dehydrogenase-like Zn-dependent dehydrogenase
LKKYIYICIITLLCKCIPFSSSADKAIVLFVMQIELPPTHRALVLESIEAGCVVKHLPTPAPEAGSAIVRIHTAGILSYHRDIYNGVRSYPFPTPLVPGIGAIGRVAAVGPDATALVLGQLVYVDCMIHGRDDPDNLFVTAIHEGFSKGSKKLMREIWRHGTMAEYAKAPLENCIQLNENKLCKELGYDIKDLMYLCYLLVPFGGLRDIRLQPGETVVIVPATGGYGGAGVLTAVAMGARVIAMGRNEQELARIRAHVLRSSPHAPIETVKLTGDEDTDAMALQALGPVDAVLDFSPPAAAQSSHVRSAIRALRRGGRVSLMGYNENPMHPSVMARNITLKGKLMYEREDIVLFMKMLEAGLFPRGKDFVRTRVFDLEDWQEAFDVGATYMGIGKYAVFVP